MLETYIGTKIIQGEPQTCQKDSHNSKVGDPGYKVVYEDGYISWSPKEVFEGAYRKTDGMTFGLAVEVMRQGLKVRLPNWPDNTSLALTIERNGVDLGFTILRGRVGSEGFKSEPWYIVEKEIIEREILQDNWQIWEEK